MFSFGIEPSTTSTNGSSSPRSALWNHSMKLSAPCSGPHSKSMSGQWTAILGSPGRAPSAISSMLGCVAAVRATESPSQLRPPCIQRIWTTPSSCSVATAIPEPPPWRLSDQGQADSKPYENKGEETKFPAPMCGLHLVVRPLNRRTHHSWPSAFRRARRGPAEDARGGVTTLDQGPHEIHQIAAGPLGL